MSQPPVVNLYIIHREIAFGRKLWMFALIPPGEDRGTFLYCDPTNPIRARQPACFERLQLLDDENLLFKEYIRPVAQTRMHGHHGFLRSVLCDQTIGVSNRGYILEALKCLEFANFVPFGTFVKWDRILKSQDPLAAARRSAAGSTATAAPSAARSQRLPASTSDDRPVNPFAAAASIPFESTGDDRPNTPFSSTDHNPLRIASSITDADRSRSGSLSMSMDSLGSYWSTTSSDRGTTPSSSVGRESLRERYPRRGRSGEIGPPSPADCDAPPRSTRTRDLGRRNSPQNPRSRTDPNRQSHLPSSRSSDPPGTPASTTGRGRGAN